MRAIGRQLQGARPRGLQRQPPSGLACTSQRRCPMPRACQLEFPQTPRRATSRYTCMPTAAHQCRTSTRTPGPCSCSCSWATAGRGCRARAWWPWNKNKNQPSEQRGLGPGFVCSLEHLFLLLFKPVHERGLGAAPPVEHACVKHV